MKAYYVYIMTNKRNTVLYTGMTGRGEIRIVEHQQQDVPSFTSRYNITKVVYAEAFPSPEQAAATEKRIKGWTRQKKIELINSINPEWDDLLNRDASLRSAIQDHQNG